MKGRNPTTYDMKLMSETISLVTAYDIGVEEDDFALFRKQMADADDNLLENMTQTAWLFLRSIAASSGHDAEDILAWYGQKFAEKALKE